MPMQVAVIGAGSWGTTVAHLSAKNVPTTLWARRDEVAAEVRDAHANSTYLTGFDLHPVAARHRQPRGGGAGGRRARDGGAVARLPGHARELAAYLRPWVPVVSLTKGLEQGTRLRMTQVLEAVLPGHPCGVLTGPNLAKEILAGDAAASVIAMEDPVIAEALQDVFASDLFRVYTNPDVIGCEVAGALKNVMAIASGMADGLGTGDNTRSAVITRGLSELTRLGCAMGGHQATFAGLAGMGDLIATCISPQSRNRYVGEQLGRGRKIDEVIAEMNMVAEGVKTSRVVMELAAEYGVDMPIAESVFAVVHEGAPATEAYRGLLGRHVRSEMHGMPSA